MMELEEKAGIETRIKSLIQIYGIIEQKELWNHMSNYLDQEMQEMEFAYIYIFPSLMSGELRVLSGETAWITVFDEPENNIVLQNRKERSPRNYRNITADELDAYMQNGIAALVPAYEDLESYFLEKELSFEGYMILQEVLAKCAALLGEWEDIEEIVREILNEDGLRLTKKVSAMIVKVLEEYPSASLKGYSRNYLF